MCVRNADLLIWKMPHNVRSNIHLSGLGHLSHLSVGKNIFLDALDNNKTSNRISFHEFKTLQVCVSVRIINNIWPLLVRRSEPSSRMEL